MDELIRFGLLGRTIVRMGTAHCMGVSNRRVRWGETPKLTTVTVLGNRAVWSICIINNQLCQEPVTGCRDRLTHPSSRLGVRGSPR